MASRPGIASLFFLCLIAPARAQEVVPAEKILSPQAAAARPASPPTTPLYDEKAVAKDQITAALMTAKRENQRVLIQWGGNWCAWCIKLNELFKSNSQIQRTLQYEYVVVHVDAGKPAGKNIELGKSYGADLSKYGFPFLTILDAEGKPLANQETAALELDGKDINKGHDPQKVMALLTRHQALPIDAQKALTDAQHQARNSGKRVFVHFGAPWCVWCHRLEAWMASPEVQPILAKEFVDLKIDTDRMTGGKEMLAKHVGSKGSGIPWFAFLDGDGKTLATSDPGGGGNIGFPAAEPEIAHFEKMLKNSTKNLSADDIAKLITSLREAEKVRAAPAGTASPRPATP
jgi:thiol:disulfide interchange protein